MKTQQDWSSGSRFSPFLPLLGSQVQKRPSFGQIWHLEMPLSASVDLGGLFAMEIEFNSWIYIRTHQDWPSGSCFSPFLPNLEPQGPQKALICPEIALREALGCLSRLRTFVCGGNWVNLMGIHQVWPMGQYYSSLPPQNFNFGPFEPNLGSLGYQMWGLIVE